jgi:hypothetical protein
MRPQAAPIWALVMLRLPQCIARCEDEQRPLAAEVSIPDSAVDGRLARYLAALEQPRIMIALHPATVDRYIKSVSALTNTM